MNDSTNNTIAPADPISLDLICEHYRGKKITCYTPGEGPITLDPDCRYAIGVGSVGQPRDDDPRACYVIYQPGLDRVEFRRIPYNIKKAQTRFKKAGLSKFDAERIAKGK
jgi:diadenosine tetraphosphatase ApaH/serine/threonine PP2A family protein phosphatase